MVAAALLAAIDFSAEAWKRLTPEQKQKIKAQYDKGAKGMAKIMATRAKKLSKQAKKVIPKKKKAKRGKR
jgi:TRAP-type C4-dicarboxylate transport system substrate-binding protein